MSKETEKLNKMFPITKICRQDLISAGYNKKEVLELDDAEMSYIAEKIGDGVMNEFWTLLDYVLVDNFKLRKVRR